MIAAARVRSLAARTMACPTAPYREGAVIAWIREFASGAPGLLLREDRDGNLELRRRGVARSRAPLVFNAHMDHPGFRAIRSTRGRRGVRVDALFLGGVRREFFPGARARFFGPDADRGASVRARVVATRIVRGALHVRLEAKRSVAAGALGMWDLPAFRIAKGRRGTRLVGRVADDLVGVAAILALFERLDAIDPKRRVDVRAVLTRA
jgi:putative aminopeptidase FrvX